MAGPEGGANFASSHICHLANFNPPCTSLHFWKPVFDMPAHPEKRCFLERRASPMPEIHHFGPPPDLYIGSFSFFTKKKQKKKSRVFGTYFSCFSCTNYEIVACDLYKKIRPKTRFFLWKTKMTPCTNQEVGQSGVFWTTETLSVQMSWHIEGKFPKMKGLTWGGIEIDQLPYMGGLNPTNLGVCN